MQQHEGTASDVAISLEDPSREGFCPYVVGSQIRIAPPTGICNPLNHVFPLATCQARRTARARPDEESGTRVGRSGGRRSEASVSRPPPPPQTLAPLLACGRRTFA